MPAIDTASVIMTNAEYHAHPAISKSQLDAIARSPAHYYARFVDPNKAPQETTDALTIGSAFHAAVLEPHIFASDFVCAPVGINKRTKDGKAEWAAFQAANAGKTILDTDDRATVIAMRDVLMANDEVRRLLRDGDAEIPIFGVDPETGAEVKCKPDYLRSDGKILDLKTTDDGSPESFAKSIVNYRYHVQNAHYHDVINWACDEAPTAFIFLVIEKKPPYAVSIYQLEPSAVEMGRRHARRNLAAIVACRKADAWPSYGNGKLQTLQLPGWAR